MDTSLAEKKTTEGREGEKAEKRSGKSSKEAMLEHSRRTDGELISIMVLLDNQ